MKESTGQFRIGHLAKELNIEKFVIRFWEKEFDIKPSRSDGGQRFYTRQDLAQFRLIQDLLHKKKYTIAGAKKLLQTSETNKNILASSRTTIDTISVDPPLLKKLQSFKLLLQQLHKII